MALDDINKVFANLAGIINEENDDPKIVAAATLGLMLMRVIVTDLRRIADAQEMMAKQYKTAVENEEAARLSKARIGK